MNERQTIDAVQAMIAIMNGQVISPISEDTDIKFLYYYKPERVIVAIRATDVTKHSFSDVNELHTINEWLIVNEY